MKTVLLQLKHKAAWGAAAALLLLASCGEEINSRRIPAMPVDINLQDPGLWATYGIGGVNSYRIFDRETGQPSGFHFLDRTYTGFGGVLIYGVSAAFQGGAAWPYMPVAFDLACPVEVDPLIKVGVDDMKMEAVCPVCESRYSLEAGGSPVFGPAVGLKYGLQRYNCVGSPTTGFRIIN